jgi:hypothetical protein
MTMTQPEALPARERFIAALRHVAELQPDMPRLSIDDIRGVYDYIHPLWWVTKDGDLDCLDLYCGTTARTDTLTPARREQAVRRPRRQTRAANELPLMPCSCGGVR